MKERLWMIVIVLVVAFLVSRWVTGDHESERLRLLSGVAVLVILTLMLWCRSDWMGGIPFRAAVVLLAASVLNNTVSYFLERSAHGLDSRTVDHQAFTPPPVGFQIDREPRRGHRTEVSRLSSSRTLLPPYIVEQNFDLIKDHADPEQNDYDRILCETDADRPENSSNKGR
jgi:hypothetical protein